MSWPGCMAAQFPNDGSSEGEVGTDCHADTQPVCWEGQIGQWLLQHIPLSHCCGRFWHGVRAALSREPPSALLLLLGWLLLPPACLGGVQAFATLTTALCVAALLQSSSWKHWRQLLAHGWCAATHFLCWNLCDELWAELLYAALKCQLLSFALVLWACLALGAAPAWPGSRKLVAALLCSSQPTAILGYPVCLWLSTGFD